MLTPLQIAALAAGLCGLATMASLALAGVLIAKIEDFRIEWRGRLPAVPAPEIPGADPADADVVPEPTPDPAQAPQALVRICLDEALTAQLQHEAKHHALYDSSARRVRIRQEIEKQLHQLGYPLPVDVDDVIRGRC